MTTKRQKKALILRAYDTSRHEVNMKYGGEGGIRTPGGLTPSIVFKTTAFNRTLPPLQTQNENCRYRSKCQPLFSIKMI